MNAKNARVINNIHTEEDLYEAINMLNNLSDSTLYEIYILKCLQMENKTNENIKDDILRVKRELDLRKVMSIQMERMPEMGDRSCSTACLTGLVDSKKVYVPLVYSHNLLQDQDLTHEEKIKKIIKIGVDLLNKK